MFLGPLLFASVVQTPEAGTQSIGVTLLSEVARTGHYARPDVLVRGKWEGVIAAYGGDDGRLFHMSMGRVGDGRTPDVTYATADAVHGDGNLTSRAALRAQIEARAPFPHLLAAYVAESAQPIDPLEAADEGRISRYAHPLGRIELRFAAEGAALPLAAVQWTAHDALLGDVSETLTYSGAVTAQHHAESWRIDSPMGASISSKVVATRSPAAPRPAPGDASKVEDIDAQPAAVEVSRIGEHVVELLIPEHDARSLAVRLADGWAVLEAPVASAVGEAMIARLEEIWPEGEFLYVAASHHHPHYVGGMRPFVARGARVVVPAGVEDYVAGLFERPRTLRPDALSKAPRAPDMIAVPRGQRWSPPGSADRLVAVEAAGKSAHTDAFMLFVLPEETLAFGGDILWIPVGPRRGKTSPRTEGLADILKTAADLPIETVMTSWPVASEGEPFAKWRSRATLEELRAFCRR